MEKLNLFEGSLNLIKPDHFEFRYEILPRLEIIGEIAKYCEVKPTKEDWEEHYIEHKDKPFFIPMIRAFTGRDISVIFLCGPNIIEQSRKTIGENYDPRKLESGTIRIDFCNLN